MRWEGLFDDLDAQVEAFERAERSAEIDERTRIEVAALSTVDRVRAAAGMRLRLRLLGGLALSGVAARIGPDWVLLDEGGGREVVVRLAAVVGIRGLPRFSSTPDSVGVVESRLGLRHALRGIARDRAPVRVHLADGSTVDATIDRVGADFVEVATHAAGEVRRRQEVRDAEMLPIAHLIAVRRAD